MSLCIELKPNEKLFVNGAVVSNGPRRAQFNDLNDDAQILREKDILTHAMADTPCKRIYLAAQLIYMDQSERDRYLDVLLGIARQVAVAAPSMRSLIEELHANLAKSDFYQNLKTAKKLVNYESELMRNAQ